MHKNFDQRRSKNQPEFLKYDEDNLDKYFEEKY